MPMTAVALALDSGNRIDTLSVWFGCLKYYPPASRALRLDEFRSRSQQDAVRCVHELHFMAPVRQAIPLSNDLG